MYPPQKFKIDTLKLAICFSQPESTFCSKHHGTGIQPLVFGGVEIATSWLEVRAYEGTWSMVCNDPRIRAVNRGMAWGGWHMDSHDRWWFRLDIL